MNYKIFRLNDELLYAMSSAIYVLESITYTTDKRYLHHYNIFFLTRTGEVEFYTNGVVINKAFTIVFRNRHSSGLSLIFDYNCAGRKVFVWL